MAKTISGTSRLYQNFSISETDATKLGSLSSPATDDVTTTYTYGTTDGKVNLLYDSIYAAIAAEATETVDLTQGTLTDRYGDAITFATVKHVTVKADANNTDNVELTGPFLKTATDAVILMPGMKLSFDVPVTGFTSADITLTNVSTTDTQKVTLILAGVSA